MRNITFDDETAVRRMGVRMVERALYPRDVRKGATDYGIESQTTASKLRILNF